MSFVYPHLNVIAILVAALSQFALGWVWYSPMTPIGKRWAVEMQTGDQPGQPGAEMLLFPISSIMAAWAVAMVFGWSGAQGWLDGVRVGWVVAFAVTGQVLSAAVAGRPRSVMLTLIHVGYVIVGYAIMGAIIAAFSTM
ncbi:MAG: DUF1761 domain-containing protein [Dehalococcoidia bacterium]